MRRIEEYKVGWIDGRNFSASGVSFCRDFGYGKRYFSHEIEGKDMDIRASAEDYNTIKLKGRFFELGKHKNFAPVIFIILSQYQQHKNVYLKLWIGQVGRDVNFNLRPGGDFFRAGSDFFPQIFFARKGIFPTNVFRAEQFSPQIVFAQSAIFSLKFFSHGCDFFYQLFLRRVQFFLHFFRAGCVFFC
jgi:hypothetical protein